MKNTNCILIDSPTASDIRATFSLAKIYRDANIDGWQQLYNDAKEAAKRYGFDHSDIDVPCPHLFSDEQELEMAWREGSNIWLEFNESIKAKAAAEERWCGDKNAENYARWH